MDEVEEAFDREGWWFAWIERTEETEDDVDLRPRKLLVRRYDDCGVMGEGECERRRAEPVLAWVDKRGCEG